VQVSKLTHQAALANLEVEQLRGALARAAGSDRLPPPFPAGESAILQSCLRFLVVYSAVGRCTVSTCALQLLKEGFHISKSSAAGLSADGNDCEADLEGELHPVDDATPASAAEPDGLPDTTCTDPQHAALSTDAAALRDEVLQLTALVKQLQGRSDQVSWQARRDDTWRVTHQTTITVQKQHTWAVRPP